MSEKKTRSGSEKRQKNVLIAVRFSPEEAEIVKEKAEKNGLTVSTLIRKTVLGKQINARIDEDFLKELMRLGRLQSICLWKENAREIKSMQRFSLL